MISTFIHIRLLDIIDIFLVALLFYQLYMLIRGTVAYSITLGIVAIYIFWWVVRTMQMELLSTILGSVLGVGVIALISQAIITKAPAEAARAPSGVT